MHKLLFIVLFAVSFGYALDYADTMQMDTKPFYSPTSWNNQRIGQPISYQPMLNDYGLPMGVPQASQPITPMQTDVEIGDLELARYKPIQRPTS